MEVDNAPSAIPSNIEKQVESLVLNYVCKLYADSKLPRSFVQEAVEDVGHLIENILDIIKPALSTPEKEYENNLLQSRSQ